MDEWKNEFASQSKTLKGLVGRIRQQLVVRKYIVDHVNVNPSYDKDRHYILSITPMYSIYRIIIYTDFETYCIFRFDEYFSLD